MKKEMLATPNDDLLTQEEIVGAAQSDGTNGRATAK